LIRAAGVEFRTGVEVRVADIENEFDAIFIGIGLGQPSRWVFRAKPFRAFTPRWISSRPIRLRGPCRWASVFGVIGGGNTAIDAALAARLLGASMFRFCTGAGRRRCPLLSLNLRMEDKLDTACFDARIQT